MEVKVCLSCQFLLGKPCHAIRSLSHALEMINPVDLDLDRKSLICVAIADIFKVSFRFSA